METLRHVSDTIRIQICVMVSVLAHDRWVELLARFMSEWIWSFTKKVPRHCLHLRLTTTSSHCISCAEETAVLPERDVSGETSVHTSLTPPPPPNHPALVLSTHSAGTLISQKHESLLRHVGHARYFSRPQRGRDTQHPLQTTIN